MRRAHWSEATAADDTPFARARAARSIGAGTVQAGCPDRDATAVPRGPYDGIRDGAGPETDGWRDLRPSVRARPRGSAVGHAVLSLQRVQRGPAVRRASVGLRGRQAPLPHAPDLSRIETALERGNVQVSGRQRGCGRRRLRGRGLSAGAAARERKPRAEDQKREDVVRQVHDAGLWRVDARLRGWRVCLWPRRVSAPWFYLNCQARPVCF